MEHVSSAFFVTLTYRSDIPMIDRTPNGFLTLNKKHLQNFFKRLRKNAKQTSKTPFNEQIKYIACGEYGSKYQRPHYHAIIFNSTEQDIIKAWTKDGKTIGIVTCDKVTPDRIRYIFKYAMKGNITKREQSFTRDDRVREFQLISQGIGKQVLDNKEWMKKHQGNISQPWITLKGGQKIAIPRYYKNKIYTDEERQMIAESMIDAYETPTLTPDEDAQVLVYKNEKRRQMIKRAKKDKDV